MENNVDSISRSILEKAELLCNSAKLYKPGLTGALPVYRYWGEEPPQFESHNYGDVDSCLQMQDIQIGSHKVWKRTYWTKSGSCRNQEFYFIPGFNILEEAENLRELCEVNFEKLLRCIMA